MRKVQSLPYPIYTTEERDLLINPVIDEKIRNSDTGKIETYTINGWNEEKSEGGELGDNIEIDSITTTYYNKTNQKLDIIFDVPPENIFKQRDGKIIFVGGFTTYNGEPRKMVRFNELLEEDKTFNICSNFNNDIYDIIEFEDNYYVFGKFTKYQDVERRTLIKFNLNWELDETFNVSVETVNNVPKKPKYREYGIRRWNEHTIYFGMAFGSRLFMMKDGEGNTVNMSNVGGSSSTNFNEIAEVFPDGDRIFILLSEINRTVFSGGVPQQVKLTRFLGIFDNLNFTLIDGFDNTFWGSGSSPSNSRLSKIVKLNNNRFALFGTVWTEGGKDDSNICIIIDRDGNIEKEIKFNETFNTQSLTLDLKLDLFKRDDDKYIIYTKNFKTLGNNQHFSPTIWEFDPITEEIQPILRLNEHTNEWARLNDVIQFRGGYLMVGPQNVLYGGKLAMGHVILGENLNNKPNTEIMYNNMVVGYGGDYHTYYNNRSFVDKEYVDKEIQKLRDELT